MNGERKVNLKLSRSCEARTKLSRSKDSGIADLKGAEYLTLEVCELIDSCES